jgi:lysophospholipase L1-like esterase
MKVSSQWKKNILTLSLFVNLIFFLLFSYIVHKRGGSSYLIERTKSIFIEKTKTASVPKSNFSLNRRTSSYYHKKSHFELLPDTDNEIIFLGDSITDWCRWSELFQNLNIKNRGIGADRTDGILLRLDEIISSSPDKIFIMIGINDLNQGVDVLDIVRNYKQIIQIISDKSPGTKIYVQSILPVNEQLLAKFYPKSKIRAENIRKLNDFLKDLSSEYQIGYINLYSLFKGDEDQLDEKFTYDGLHLRGEAYLIWKSYIEQDVLN